MKFTKMHGLGNDYIYIDCFKEKIEKPSKLAKEMSDRHFGVGSDGIVLIMPSQIADFKMRIFNSDGSEAEMCGNGIRCFGKYVFDNKMTDKSVVSVETLGGIKILHMITEEGKVTLVKVDMGEPILEPSRIPAISNKDKFISEEIEINDKKYKVSCVSMGNPHAIVYLDDIDKLEIEKIGPKFEHNKLFPNRINTEFVKVIDRRSLQMRVWERGSGETLACGTGACAVLVSSVLNNYSDRKAMIKLLGGNLTVEWDEKDNHVYMTGPAVEVFEGEW